MSITAVPLCRQHQDGHRTFSLHIHHKPVNISPIPLTALKGSDSDHAACDRFRLAPALSREQGEIE